MSQEIEVTNNEKEHRFEARRPEGIAFTSYRLTEGAIEFTHTEVPESLKGQGVGGELVKGALEWARGRRLQIVPMCSFVDAYVKRHDEWWEHVHPDYRE
jgi:predicted GNAT family acetyltransferase